MNDCVRQALENRCVELVAKCIQASTLLLSLFDCELRRASKSDNARNVFRSWSATAILCAAVQQRLQRCAASNEQRANSLWRANLVTGNRKQIELLPGRVDLDFSEGLNSVCVHQHAARSCVLGKSGQWLNSSDLVVDPHH